MKQLKSNWSHLDILQTTISEGLLPFAMKNIARWRVQIRCGSFKCGHFMIDTFLPAIKVTKVDRNNRITIRLAIQDSGTPVLKDESPLVGSSK